MEYTQGTHRWIMVKKIHLFKTGEGNCGHLKEIVRSKIAKMPLNKTTNINCLSKNLKNG